MKQVIVIRSDKEPNREPFRWDVADRTGRRKVMLVQGDTELNAYETTESDSGDCVIKIKQGALA